VAVAVEDSAFAWRCALQADRRGERDPRQRRQRVTCPQSSFL
jgi:hypothetical protein